MWKFFLTCPMLACSCWEFILHILCWLLDVGSFCYTSCAWCWLLCVGSFSYTSCAGFLMWGVFLTHPELASLCGEFSYTSCAGFFVWGVSLTCTVLASSCEEFLLHIPCWLLYVGVFLLHFHASFFMLVVSLTHHMLAV